MSSALISLAEYTFNIRSFHPQKSFGYSGFWFGGDNRGFSTAPNKQVSSRIEHLLRVDLGKRDLFQIDTQSDPSKPPWSDEDYHYAAKSLKPKFELKRKDFYSLRRQDRHWAEVKGRYFGYNHAMPGSASLAKNYGTTYVPAINVEYHLSLEVNCRDGYMDLVLSVNGDVFPNHEALVVGPSGQRVFLGGHVRSLTASTALFPIRGTRSTLIATALRLPLKQSGGFKGRVAKIGPNQRTAEGAVDEKKLKYRSIDSWNQELTVRNPNAGRCMALESLSLEGCWPAW